jgi:hypothetical protein
MKRKVCEVSDIYETIPHRVRAEQFDGTNFDKIIALVGAENCISGGERFQVRSHYSRDWRDIFTGDWLTKDLDDDFTIIHSGSVFAHGYRETK